MPTESSNAIIGDNFGTDIPETQVDDKELMEEKKAARYSKSKEFKRIQAHMLARIEHFQKFLPNGEAVQNAQPTSEDWRVANTLINEFLAVINFYEEAAEIVKEREG